MSDKQYSMVMQREQASVVTTDLLKANTWKAGIDLMSTITLPASDPRGSKAVAIATNAGQWLKCRTRDGHKAYGIPSSKDANHIYFTTRTGCTCYDAQRHTCKHMLAVQLHCALVDEQRTNSRISAQYDDIFKRFEGE